jgi:hypothetical protein
MGKSTMPYKPFLVRSCWVFPILGIILLSFGLRLHHLDAFSFWTDEGLTPLRSGYSIPEILSNTITIQAGSGQDTHPPLYYLIIHFSRNLWGETDFAYRYPSVLAGILLVPLVYQFGRRLKNRWLGLLAAGVTAVNPLQIWYAQEARMYTLLVLLAALTSYVLWQALTTRRDLRRSLILYLILASLTIYTHYTAVFLIGVQSIFWAWLLWQRGHKKLLVGSTLLLIIIIIPLLSETFPRLFTGVEANYFYVQPFIMLQDVVHAFSLGVTIDFKLLSTRLLDWGALGLLLAGFIAAPGWRHRSFLFFYLYAVVFGLMGGSLIKPMYQGVRHIMIGSPAFLLLLAWGLFWLVQRMMTARRRRTAVGWGSLVALGFLILTAGPTLSLNNLYTNSHYAKNDFKSLITYVEQKAGTNDLLIFNDAVLLPLYDQYQQRTDISVTALPTYPYPANDQTITDLTALAQTYQRIWLITSPPADDRDNNSLVQGWLTDHFPIVDNHSFGGRTIGVQVLAFDTQPQAVTNLPGNGRSLNIQWPTSPSLKGIQLLFDQPAALPTLWFNLFWEGGTQPDPDTQIRLVLRGPDDQEWSTSQNQRLMATAVSWDTPLVRQSYYLPIPIGTPPGIYTLYAEPLADNSPLGNTQSLVEIELAASSSWPIQTKPSVNTSSLNFQNGLTLVGATLFDDEVRPGHNLPFILYWQAADSFIAENLRYEIELIAPDGRVLKRQEGTPGASWLDTWPSNTPITQHSSFYFGPETEPGRYQLRWRLLEGESNVNGRPPWRPWFSKTNFAGEVEVKPWPLVTTLPNDVTPIQVDFGPDIQLSGYTYEQTGRTLDVTLYWRTIKVPTINYLSFVHLVAADGTIAAQQAFLPVNGLRPPQTWRVGEILTDAYSLAIPTDLPAGIYTINAGLFDLDTGERPQVVYQDQPQVNNQFNLGTITLP